MNENISPYNQQVVPVYTNQRLVNQPTYQRQATNVIIMNQETVQTSARIYNQQGQPTGQVVISYEKNELVALIAGGTSLSKENTEKARINQYNSVNVDDPELFDGKIKCVRLKCIVFGIITAILNTLRLGYLTFLHLGYPAIIWFIRFFCAIVLFLCYLCNVKEETKQRESESGLERIDYVTNLTLACSLCTNCAQAFVKFFKNFFSCPCWFYNLLVDCCYDIKNRALDNARTGCYKFIHYDFGCYEKNIEDPFNNYIKKKHIILTTDPDDDTVIYGDACKDNTII